MTTKSYKPLLYSLAAVKFILPFLLQSSVYELHRDEFLYLAESRHMAWGFMEAPPLLSVFAWLTGILGNSFFWVKFWAALFGAFTFILTGKIILSLGGKSFALFIAFLAFVTGAYLREHFLFQPNFLEVFFWTAIAYSLIRFAQTQKNKWLYAMGACIGLGMMSKYSAAFFVVSILLGLLITPQRAVFRNKHFYFALLLAFLIFLPNLMWQWLHHFPVAHHMSELQKTQLRYVSPIGFLISQLLVNLPCVFVWLSGLLWLAFSRRAKQFRFIAWAYVFVIVILLLGRGKDYYALGAYPMLFAFGAYRLEKFASGKLKFLRYVFAAFILFLGYSLLPILLPIYKPEKLAAFYQKRHMEKFGVLKWEDLQNHPLPQDFADMLGREELAQKVATAYNALDSAEKKRTIIFCSGYGDAGALIYYSKKYHLPEAYSNDASFAYWLPDKLQFDNLILVTDDKEKMQQPFIKNFQSAIVADSITNSYAREKGTLIIVLKNGNAENNQYLQKAISQ